MNLLENIRLALSGLKTSKMRSLLTMLGIIIGIGSVIAIVTLGNSLTGSLTDTMSSLGVNNVDVYLMERDDENIFNVSYALEDDDKFTIEMIENLQAAYPDEIDSISLIELVGYGKAQDSRLYANVNIAGTSSGYGSANNLDILEGRYIIDRDVNGKKEVAVVSDKFVYNMFGKNANLKDAIEKEVKIYLGNDIYTYVIVGIYEYVPMPFANMMGASASEQNLRTEMYIPVSTAKKVNGSGTNYDYFTAVVNAYSNKAEAVELIKSFFERYYNEESNYKVNAVSMESMLEQMTTMLATVQLAVAAIAAISLLVGGIGVMNIMLVSVTERTREIGTRKALGARSSAIRVQFVVEAMIICLIGGIIGIVFGIALGSLGAALLGSPAQPSVPIIIIAVMFSMVIGVFFGYYPANKAAKLDPIEALRYE